MTLTGNQIDLLNRQNNADPFVWLYAFTIPSSPVQVLRVAAYDKPIQYLTDSAGEPITWSPFPVRHEGIEMSSDGAQEVLRISVGNVTREAQALIELYDGLTNQDVRVYLVNVAALGDPIPFVEVKGKVVSSVASERAAAFSIGVGNLLRTFLPRTRILRKFCRHQYKGAACAYSGAIVGCDKTLDGPNGCIVHANADRFGGFPGVGKS
jgi:phage-related protein